MVRKIKMIGFLISDSKSDFSFEKMDAVKTFLSLKLGKNGH